MIRVFSGIPRLSVAKSVLQKLCLLLLSKHSRFMNTHLQPIHSRHKLLEEEFRIPRYDFTNIKLCGKVAV